MALPARIQKLLDKSKMWYLNKPLAPPTAQETALAREFKEKMQRLDVCLDPTLPAAELFWNANMLKLKELAIHNDPREFLSWDVVKGTMFVKYAKYSRPEYSYLKNAADWPRWQKAIREDKVGHPPPCPFDTSTSCNLVHHAYHVAKYEQSMGDSVGNYSFALEFGGGYGGMCRLFHKLGFQGRYLIFDLPAFSILQEYFLKSIGLKVLSKSEFLSGEQGVLCTSEMSVLDELKANDEKRLLVATWSLSESPISTREQILRHADLFDAYLIALQPKFEDIDNLLYFDAWRKSKPRYDWIFEEMEHILKQRYLFGKKR